MVWPIYLTNPQAIPLHLPLRVKIIVNDLAVVEGDIIRQRIRPVNRGLAGIITGLQSAPTDGRKNGGNGMLTRVAGRVGIGVKLTGQFYLRLVSSRASRTAAVSRLSP